MFKKTSMGVAALTFLSSDCKATKINYRPPEGATPWHKAASHSSWDEPTWKVDYFVPNFGPQSVDVAETQANIANAEGKLNHKL
jgi:hypothetical protein